MPTNSSCHRITSRFLMGAAPLKVFELHGKHPLPAVLNQGDRFTSTANGVILEILPNIFLADKKGAKNFAHVINTAFTHILVREEAKLAPGHHVNSSIQILIQNQKQISDINWEAPAKQNFFEAPTRDSHGAVFPAPGQGQPGDGIHSAFAACYRAEVAGMPVLISCGSAKSRSPAFVAMYMIYRFNITGKDARLYINGLCAQAGPHNPVGPYAGIFKPKIAPGFVGQMDYWEDDIRTWHVIDHLP